jgi:hypothetical protein
MPLSSSSDDELKILSGKATVRGKQHAVNADFARHVLFISDQLGASERHVASLLQAATAIRPHSQPAEAVEEAVVLYHTRRRVAIDCLLLTFQAALESEESDAPTVCARIDTFARQHLLPPPVAGKDTLAAVILREMASVDEMLDRSLAAKQAAVSQTAVPSTTGTPKHSLLPTGINLTLSQVEQETSATTYLRLVAGHSDRNAACSPDCYISYLASAALQLAMSKNAATGYTVTRNMPVLVMFSPRPSLP